MVSLYYWLTYVTWFSQHIKLNVLYKHTTANEQIIKGATWLKSNSCRQVTFLKQSIQDKSTLANWAVQSDANLSDFANTWNFIIILLKASLIWMSSPLLWLAACVGFKFPVRYVSVQVWSRTRSSISRILKNRTEHSQMTQGSLFISFVAYKQRNQK